MTRTVADKCLADKGRSDGRDDEFSGKVSKSRDLIIQKWVDAWCHLPRVPREKRKITKLHYNWSNF